MKDETTSEGNALQNPVTGATREGDVTTVSRREVIGRFAFYGTAMALARQVAFARNGSSGSYSTAAVALPATSSPSGSDDDTTKAVKIARASSSPAIPIGPHWMVLWPFDAKHCGLPTTVRDAGAWIMFSGTPYAYLHICGTPWDGNQYSPGDEALWTMQYSKPRVPT